MKIVDVPGVWSNALSKIVVRSKMCGLGFAYVCPGCVSSSPCPSLWSERQFNLLIMEFPLLCLCFSLMLPLCVFRKLHTGRVRDLRGHLPPEHLLPQPWATAQLYSECRLWCWLRSWRPHLSRKSHAAVEHPQRQVPPQLRSVQSWELGTDPHWFWKREQVWWRVR